MSSIKYHINPKTGNPGRCRAKVKCPFAGPEGHYSSAEKARSAFEFEMSLKRIDEAVFNLLKDKEAKRKFRYHVDPRYAEVEECKDPNCTHRHQPSYGAAQNYYEDRVNDGTFPVVDGEEPMGYTDFTAAVERVDCPHCYKKHDIRSREYQGHLAEAIEDGENYVANTSDAESADKHQKMLEQEKNKVIRARRAIEKFAADQSSIIEAAFSGPLEIDYYNTDADTVQRRLDRLLELQESLVETQRNLYSKQFTPDDKFDPFKIERATRNIKSLLHTNHNPYLSSLQVTRDHNILVECPLRSCKTARHIYGSSIYHDHRRRSLRERLKNADRNEKKALRTIEKIQQLSLESRTLDAQNRVARGSYVASSFFGSPDLNEEETKELIASQERLEEIKSEAAALSDEYKKSEHYDPSNNKFARIAEDADGGLKVISSVRIQDSNMARFRRSKRQEESGSKAWVEFRYPKFFSHDEIHHYLTDTVHKGVAELSSEFEQAKSHYSMFGNSAPYKTLSETPVENLTLGDLEDLIKYEKTMEGKEVKKGMKMADSGMKGFFGVMEHYEETVYHPTEKMVEIDSFIRDLPPRAREARKVYLEASEFSENDPDNREHFEEVKSEAERVYRRILEEEEREKQANEEKLTQSIKRGLLDRLATNSSKNSLDLDI